MSNTNIGSEGQMIQLTADDGFSFAAFKAMPEGTSKGGLVIIQEIFGVTDQLKSVARSYAKQGFEAIVPALFDRHTPNTIVAFDQPGPGRDMAMSLDPGKVLLDVAASVKEVGKNNGASLIGFCWGGGQAFRLAYSLELNCSIAFYGTALKIHIANNPDGLKCPMLFHFGETDDHSPPEVIEALRQAVPSAEIHIYQAGHAFANDARTTYVKDAANLAHERTLEFLNKHHPA